MNALTGQHAEQQQQQHPTILRIKRRRRDDHEALDALGAPVASGHRQDMAPSCQRLTMAFPSMRTGSHRSACKAWQAEQDW